MSESFSTKLGNEAKAFVTAPIYPFIQKDWPIKMWLFLLLSYVPFINVIVARGWRKDYINRIGWKRKRVLPHPKDFFQFLVDGIVLWFTTGIYLLIPIILIAALGLGGWVDFWNDVKFVRDLTLDHFWLKEITWNEYADDLWLFVKNELWATFWVFLIENIYLVVYIPMYRIAMIRYALTGKLLKSHFSFWKNFKFLFRNLFDILLMYAFNIFNFILVIAVDVLFSFTGVGVFFIAVFTFFMPFWNTGYEYGFLARVMVEQEGLKEREVHKENQSQGSFEHRNHEFISEIEFV
jgi:hypothetical protein